MHCGMKHDSMDAAGRLVGASRHDDGLEPWSIGSSPCSRIILRIFFQVGVIMPCGSLKHLLPFEMPGTIYASGS